jgi:hypothetical protein
MLSAVAMISEYFNALSYHWAVNSRSSSWSVRSLRTLGPRALVAKS